MNESAETRERRCSWCWSCDNDRRDENPLGWIAVPYRMNVCPECGNKRCPRATSHTNACTASNEPNQPGSRYGGL